MPNEENLVSLKKRRSVIQGSCTRIRTFVDSITSVSSSIKAQVEERKVKLSQLWSDFEVVQAQIEEFDENEVSYLLMAKMREILNPVLPTSSSISSSPSPGLSFVGDSNAHVRLPKINLLTFTGKYDEWYPFFDTFTAIIHSNTSLSDI